MIYKRLIKEYFDNNNKLDYGYLSETDIKAQTYGFKEFIKGVYTRRNCKYYYYTID